MLFSAEDEGFLLLIPFLNLAVLYYVGTYLRWQILNQEAGTSLIKGLTGNPKRKNNKE